MKSQNSKPWIYIATLVASSLLCLSCTEKPSYVCTVDSEFFDPNKVTTEDTNKEDAENTDKEDTEEEEEESEWDSIEDIQDAGYVCMLGKWVCPVGGKCENADKPQEKPCKEECTGLLQCIDGKCACPEDETCVSCDENCDEKCGRPGICVPTEEEIIKDGVSQGFKGECVCSPVDDTPKPSVTSVCDCTGEKCIIKDTNQSCNIKNCDVDKNILVEYTDTNDEKKQIRAKCIENMQDLANISPNKSDNKDENAYIIVNNIALTEAYNSIGKADEPKAFKGILLGAGHKIQGTLKCTQDYCGIFSKLDGALIDGINFESFELKNSNKSYTGVIAGEAVNSTIRNITVDNTKEDEPILHLGNHGGGIVGSMQNTTINNAHVITDIKRNSETNQSIIIGGIVGSITNGLNKINSSSFIGNMLDLGSSTRGGIVGEILTDNDIEIHLDKLFSYGDFILPEMQSYEGYAGGIIGSINDTKTKATLTNSYSLADLADILVSGGLFGNYTNVHPENIKLENNYFLGKLGEPTDPRKIHPIFAYTNTSETLPNYTNNYYYKGTKSSSEIRCTSFTLDDTTLVITQDDSSKPLIEVLNAFESIWEERSCKIPLDNTKQEILLPVIKGMPFPKSICNE